MGRGGRVSDLTFKVYEQLGSSVANVSNRMRDCLLILRNLESDEVGAVLS